MIDSGSTDGTQEIARNRGAHVLEWDWPGYAKQRQRALSVGSHPWVGYIDSDECLSPELRAVVQATVLDGLTTREAALLLGIPPGTVKTRMMRAKPLLREALV